MPTSTARPWGLTRATVFEEETVETPPASMSIDPHTQLTTYRDIAGRVLHAGPPKHGTSRQTVTSQPTSGGDGQHKNSPDDARVVTYVPD
ncbi:putative ATP-grasp-modified RiPP [Kribbella sp. NPDC058693]|uniref:putative ATP-grasp-modified RiPP n=1 Tax=Kribbella sp. NPDC058693 TaxID=3346602 RepID=UPI0036519C4C